MFTVVPAKATLDVFTEAMYDTYVRDNLNKGVMRPVAGGVLAADAASFSFTGVSALDFLSLVAVVSARSTVAASSSNWLMRFNGDSGANYVYQRGWGRAAVVSAAASGLDTSLIGLNIPGGTAPANVFGASLVFLPSIRSGEQRMVTWFAGSKFANATNSAYCGYSAGRWTNTTADLTSVTFSPLAGDFAAGSSFYLYGAGVA